MAEISFSTLLLVAQVMSGEAGVLDSDAALLDVGAAIANRVEDPRWPDTAEAVVAQGFYGRGPVSFRHLKLARAALSGGHVHDYYYCYSEQDRRAQGWAYGDKTYRRDGWTMYLRKDEP